jgi:hypothetical protein
MTVGGEDKGFLQFDWWRAKVYMLNSLEDVNMATLLGRFGTKNLFSGGKFVPNIYGNPNSL